MGLFSFKSNTRKDLGRTQGQMRFCKEYRTEKNIRLYRVKQFITSFNPALLALLPFWICFLLLFLYNKPALQETDFIADRVNSFLNYFKEYWSFK